MNRDKITIQKKEILAILFSIVIFFLFRSVLLFVGAKLNERKENELIQQKMNAMMDIVSYGNLKREAACAASQENRRF